MVLAGAAPAVPLGVSLPALAPTTVTAVTVLLAPFGKVVVCSTVEVTELDDSGAAVDEVAALESTVTVTTLPVSSVAVTTDPADNVLAPVFPEASVVVMTPPRVKPPVRMPLKGACEGVELCPAGVVVEGLLAGFEVTGFEELGLAVEFVCRLASTITLVAISALSRCRASRAL